MHFCVVSLFPNYMDSALQMGVIGKGINKGLLQVSQIDVRTYGGVPRCDDRVYGGGPGMVLSYYPIIKAIMAAKERLPEAAVILMSPRGKTLDNHVAQQLAKSGDLILLCGHYEGIDERIVRVYVDLELSVGCFVLSNGNLAALTVIDAVARFLPGVVGDARSVARDSFEQNSRISYSVFTRPSSCELGEVPEVLLSGNHKAIEMWREMSSIVNSVIKGILEKSTQLKAISSVSINAVYKALNNRTDIVSQQCWLLESCRLINDVLAACVQYVSIDSNELSKDNLHRISEMVGCTEDVIKWVMLMVGINII